MPQQPIADNQRLLLVDLLRGAALLGILAVNCWLFASPWMRAGAPDPAYSTGVDGLAYSLTTLLFATKSYLLFAFLFGVSFVLQQQAAERAGADFGRRMSRRLVGLIALGLLHGLLLFPGDILLTYGLLGFGLLAMAETDPRRLLRRAVLLTVIPAAILGSLGLLAWHEPQPLSAADVATVAEGITGSPWDVLASNAGLYPSTLGTIMFVQALPALAAMLVGVVVARTGYLTDTERQRRDWQRWRVVAPLIGLSGAVAFVAWSSSARTGPVLLALAITIVTAPFLTATYVALLASWWRRAPGNRVLLGIVAAGKLALTNYLGQSLALSLIFTGYGLAWAGRASAVQTVLIVLLIFSAQVLLSAWWVRRHRYGPAEWLLRRWTYRTRN